MIFNSEIYFLESYYLYNYWDEYYQLLEHYSSEIILSYLINIIMCLFSLIKNSLVRKHPFFHVLGERVCNSPTPVGLHHFCRPFIPSPSNSTPEEDWLTDSLTHTLIHSLSYPLAHLFTHSLSHSLTHSLTKWPSYVLLEWIAIVN